MNMCSSVCEGTLLTTGCVQCKCVCVCVCVFGRENCKALQEYRNNHGVKKKLKKEKGDSVRGSWDIKKSLEGKKHRHEGNREKQ